VFFALAPENHACKNAGMKKVVTLIAIAILISVPACVGATEHIITVAPTGELAKVDNKSLIDAIELLTNGTPEQRKSKAADVLKHPDRYAPPALYCLSRYLFDQGDKDAGSFWFYAAQIRARCDANILTDVSARSATSVMTQVFGHRPNRYMMVEHFDRFRPLLAEVVEWDKKTPHHYERRWMAHHGMNAFVGNDNQAVAIPRSKWAKTDEGSRIEYMDGFEEVLRAIEKQRATGSVLDQDSLGE
jgi:hypothetical protein